MSRSPSGSNEDEHVESPRVGLAAAGIACLTLITGGVVVSGLVANGLTSEYGIDVEIGLDDVIWTVIFNLPAVGLTALAVRWLRRAGLPVMAGWVCLLTAVLLATLSIAFIAFALAEFADREGTGPVLFSRASTAVVLVIAILLARVGWRFLRGAADGTG